MTNENFAPTLHWVGEDNTPNIYCLEKPEITIGRHPNCDIVIDVPTVSRLHATIRLDKVRYVLVDEKSKLGTRLNGKLVSQSAVLEDADTISVASFELKFRDPFSTKVESENTSAQIESDPAALVVNLQTGEVQLAGTLISLSPKEYSLLALLYSNRGRVCSREEIRRGVWLERSPEDITDTEIDTLVARLRRKVETSDSLAKGNYCFIVTVKPVRGFRFGK